MIEFWGKTTEDVWNKPIFEAVPEARNQGFEELLNQVVSTGQSYSASELPITLPRKGGVETVFINFAYEPIRESDGTISGIIAMAIDVTEHVLSRKKIEESERELQIRRGRAYRGTGKPEKSFRQYPYQFLQWHFRYRNDQG